VETQAEAGNLTSNRDHAAVSLEIQPGGGCRKPEEERAIPLPDGRGLRACEELRSTEETVEDEPAAHNKPPFLVPMGEDRHTFKLIGFIPKSGKAVNTFLLTL